MRIMALDIGEKRVGIAICDPGERIVNGRERKQQSERSSRCVSGSLVSG